MQTSTASAAFRAAAVVALLWSQGGCAAHGASASSAPFAASPPAAASEAPTDGLALGQVLAVGPSGLTLPVFLRPQPGYAQSFSVAAARALRRVYEEDDDDASALEALQHRLQIMAENQPQKPASQVGPFVQAWQPTLAAGVLRAHALCRHAQGIRALREAYKDSFVDDSTHAVRRMQKAACLRAKQGLNQLLQEAPKFVLTVEPLGPTPLDTLLGSCTG